jgi:hypothetical protein
MNEIGGWLPLFPLDLALMPGALLPLHVFEPRYQSLVRRSLERSRPFGVVRLHEGSLAQIGCTAWIVQVLQTYPDGRSDILVRGEGRFALLDLREHEDGYLEARAGSVRDESGSEPDPQDRLLLERLFREYAKLSEDDDLPGGVPDAADAEGAFGGPSAAVSQGGWGEETGPESASDAAAPANAEAGADGGTVADADRFSFALAARMPLGVDERQALLETRSERDRASALLGHLARLVPRLRAHEQGRRKVRGNGKPFPSED